MNCWSEELRFHFDVFIRPGDIPGDIWYFFIRPDAHTSGDGHNTGLNYESGVNLESS